MRRSSCIASPTSRGSTIGPVILSHSGAKPHTADTFDWRKWAYDKAQGRDRVDDAVVIVQPWVKVIPSTRPADGYLHTATLIVEGLAAAGAISPDRRVAALIVRAALPCGQDGVRVEVLPARRLAALLNEHVPRRSVKKSARPKVCA